MNKDYYAPGTYLDPMAPWNEVDIEDEVIEYQDDIYVQRLNDEPDAWIAEGITQGSSDRSKELYKWVIKNLQKIDTMDVDDTLLGKYVRELVREYTMPSLDEANDAVMDKYRDNYD
jgi:hypothetical protein